MKKNAQAQPTPSAPEAPALTAAPPPEPELEALQRDLGEARTAAQGADEKATEQARLLGETRERRAELEADRLDAMRRGDGEARVRISRDALQALADEQDRGRLLEEAKVAATAAWRIHGSIAEKIGALTLARAKAAKVEELTALLTESANHRRALDERMKRWGVGIRELEQLGGTAEISELVLLREDERRRVAAAGFTGDLL